VQQQQHPPNGQYISDGAQFSSQTQAAQSAAQQQRIRQMDSISVTVLSFHLKRRRHSLQRSSSICPANTLSDSTAYYPA
jgi:hypothetical protein